MATVTGSAPSAVAPVSGGLLQNIGNPQIADIPGKFRLGQQQGREDKSRELAGEILGATLGGKLGDLSKVDPKAALFLAEKTGIPANDKQRQEAFVGTMQILHTIATTTGIEDAKQFLAEKINMNQQLGIDTKGMESQLQTMQDNPELAIKSLEQINKSLIAQGFIKDPKKAAKDEPTLVREMRAFGIDPKSREGRELFVKIKTKPGVKVTVGDAGFKVPAGFILKDKNDPTKGVTPIPGGPKDNVAGQNAGKVQMLSTAKKASKGIRDLVFDKSGEVDRVNLLAAKFNIPGTQGRKLATRMRFGIQAITRIETGANMPQDEVENTEARFFPQVGDSKEDAILKLDMFDDFVSGTLKLLDPSGRFDEERFQTEFDRRTAEKGGQKAGRFKIEVLP